MKLRNISHCRQGWCWQEKEVMRLIRSTYKDNEKRLTTALAVYQSLTELASNNAKDSFTANYSKLSEYSGKSTSTVKIYCKDFMHIQILNRKFRKQGKTNLANEWSLLTPSVNNNYPTSPNNSSLTSVNNTKRELEDNNIENIDKKKDYSNDEVSNKGLELIRETLIKKGIYHPVTQVMKK